MKEVEVFFVTKVLRRFMKGFFFSSPHHLIRMLAGFLCILLALIMFL